VATSTFTLIKKLLTTEKYILMENEQQSKQKISFAKMIMDDFMLLMFLGVTIYAIFYLLWGVMELSNLPAIPEEIKNNLIK